MSDATELPYAQALDELESILRRLDADDLDVDTLAAEVARAHQLVQLCRARIAGARLQVEQVVAALGDEAPTGT